MAEKTSAAKPLGPDEDNPEWTPQDLKGAKSAAELLPQFIGEKATRDLLSRSRGRPTKADRKVNQTLRLDPDVLEAYRHQGSGWQTRINEILREHMPGRDK